MLLLASLIIGTTSLAVASAEQAGLSIRTFEEDLAWRLGTSGTHNRLREIREATGSNITDFCLHYGIGEPTPHKPHPTSRYSAYSSLESGNRSPLTKGTDGCPGWTSDAIMIADRLGMDVEWIFPNDAETMMRACLGAGTVFEQLEGALLSTSADDARIVIGCLRDLSGEIMTPRQIFVFDRWIDGMFTDDKPRTYSEIGKEMGLHKERVRQITIQMSRRIRDALKSEWSTRREGLPATSNSARCIVEMLDWGPDYDTLTWPIVKIGGRVE